MKMQWTRAVRTSLCAAALLGASLAQAQTPPPPSAGASAEHPQAAPHQHGHKPHHGPKSQQHKANSKHHQAGPGGHRTPRSHEAAAVRQGDRAGRGPESHGAATEFERNALLRCSVFKAPDDRQACEHRVRSTGSGSVEGGGILREYTQIVPLTSR